MTMENEVRRHWGESGTESPKQAISRAPFHGLFQTSESLESISNASKPESGAECQIDDSESTAASEGEVEWSGDELRQRREAAGIKQAEVAEELGIPAAAVSYVESGTIGSSFPKQYVAAIERLVGRRAS